MYYNQYNYKIPLMLTGVLASVTSPVLAPNKQEYDFWHCSVTLLISSQDSAGYEKFLHNNLWLLWKYLKLSYFIFLTVHGENIQCLKFRQSQRGDPDIVQWIQIFHTRSNFYKIITHAFILYFLGFEYKVLKRVRWVEIFFVLLL